MSSLWIFGDVSLERCWQTEASCRELHILQCILFYPLQQVHTFMFCFGDVCMYWFIGVGVKNSTDIMVEATAVDTIEFTCLESCHVVVEMYSLMGMVAGVTANFGPFCSKDFSSGDSSFLERLITHLS